MIRYKIGYCIDCKDSIERPLIAKRCSFHYRINMNKRSMDRIKERAVKYGVDLVEDKRKMDQWFRDRMTSPKICENCGKDLSGLNEKEWRGSQHHILEKSIFESVKFHPLNHLVLGFYCCHSIVSNDPEKIIEMRCFDKAKSRVRYIRNEIIYTELRRIPYYFEY